MTFNIIGPIPDKDTTTYTGPIYDAKASLKLDKDCVERYGMAISDLMQCAAFQTARLIKTLYPNINHVTIIAGKGHNGADALATAAHLANWVGNITILCPKESDNLLFQHHLQVAEKRSNCEVQIPATVAMIRQSLNDTDLIIDGLLGVGLQGPVRTEYIAIIEAMNQAKCAIMSLDIPSGNYSPQHENGPAVKPDTTITYGFLKDGYSKACWGDTYIADIGIPNT